MEVTGSHPQEPQVEDQSSINADHMNYNIRNSEEYL
jgi:hypothetical protein